MKNVRKFFRFLSRLDRRSYVYIALLLFVGVTGYTVGRLQTRTSSGAGESNRPGRSRGFDMEAKLSPFQAIRWNKPNVPEVKINGSWYELVSLNGLRAAQIIEACQKEDPNSWQKRFAEDLAEIMSRMGHMPGLTVTVEARSLDSGQTVVLADVPNTEENRVAIVENRKRLESSKKQ